MQVGFRFDASSCVGCRACVAACADAHDLPVGVFLRTVKTYECGRWERHAGIPIPVGVSAHSISLSCNHCAHPACADACPRAVVHADAATGLVLIDDEACIGCGRCAKACPYDAPRIVPRLSEEGLLDGKGVRRTRFHAVKCDCCRNAPEGPACVAACTMRCLEFGDIGQLRRRYGSCAEGDELPTASRTQPNLVYGPSLCRAFGETGPIAGTKGSCTEEREP